MQVWVIYFNTLLLGLFVASQKVAAKRRINGDVLINSTPLFGYRPYHFKRRDGAFNVGQGSEEDSHSHESRDSSLNGNQAKLPTQTITIHKEVKVPIPIHQPYPIEIPVHKPVPVRIEKAIPVPVKVLVSRPVPVPVDKPVPFPIEKRIPIPVKVPVEIPVPVKIPVKKEVRFPVKIRVPVPQPYPIKIEKPYPVYIERKIPVPAPYPVPVKIAVPKPYPVHIKVPYAVHYARHIPVPVKVPVERPYPVPVVKPYAVYVEKEVPVKVEKEVPYPVQVPVDRPVAVPVIKLVPVPVEKEIPVPVEKPVPVPVELHVPVPVEIPVERPVPVLVPKPVPVEIEKQIPYAVEKIVPFPVKVPLEKPVPTPIKKPTLYPVEGETHDNHNGNGYYSTDYHYQFAPSHHVQDHEHHESKNIYQYSPRPQSQDHGSGNKESMSYFQMQYNIRKGNNSINKNVPVKKPFQYLKHHHSFDSEFEGYENKHGYRHIPDFGNHDDRNKEPLSYFKIQYSIKNQDNESKNNKYRDEPLQSELNKHLSDSEYRGYIQSPGLYGQNHQSDESLSYYKMNYKFNKHNDSNENEQFKEKPQATDKPEEQKEPRNQKVINSSTYKQEDKGKIRHNINVHNPERHVGFIYPQKMTPKGNYYFMPQPLVSDKYNSEMLNMYSQGHQPVSSENYDSQESRATNYRHVIKNNDDERISQPVHEYSHQTELYEDYNHRPLGNGDYRKYQYYEENFREPKERPDFYIRPNYRDQDSYHQSTYNTEKYKSQYQGHQYKPMDYDHVSSHDTGSQGLREPEHYALHRSQRHNPNFEFR